MSKTIQLSVHGKIGRERHVARVDDEDYEYLMQFSWTAQNTSSPTWYASGRVNGEHTYMHRIIMNCPRGTIVDHENGDGLDNRRSNLRLSTRSQNTANSLIYSTNTSGFKGVSWNKSMRKWEANISINGKKIYLGVFSDPLEAALSYDTAARELFREFALVNF